MDRLTWIVLVVIFVVIVNLGSMMVPGYRTGTKLYQTAVRFGIIAVVLVIGFMVLRR